MQQGRWSREEKMGMGGRLQGKWSMEKEKWIRGRSHTRMVSDFQVLLAVSCSASTSERRRERD